MEKREVIEIACDCYCKCCDTKECEEFFKVGLEYNCEWVNKFRRKLVRNIKN